MRGCEVEVRVGEYELVIVFEVLSEMNQIHCLDAEIQLLIHHFREDRDGFLQFHVLHAGNRGQTIGEERQELEIALEIGIDVGPFDFQNHPVVRVLQTSSIHLGNAATSQRGQVDLIKNILQFLPQLSFDDFLHCRELDAPRC